MTSSVRLGLCENKNQHTQKKPVYAAALISLIFLVMPSACVEYKCCSSVDYAVEQANNFCSKGNNDKELCESLKIDNRVCGISKNNNNACMALGTGIQAFIRMPYEDCRALNETRCKASKVCELSFKDPFNMKFGDFQKARIKK